MKNKVKESLRKCLKDEAEALMLVAQSIDETDILFFDYLSTCKGKVIITGVGKSRLIGSKIAGTWCSLGIHAISISPLDMLHGDLGFISSDDLIVAISNSGETTELLTLIKHLKSNYNNRILSITGRKETTLARLSDVSKEISVIEAGPFGVVPTSSTTAVMAYGDAIATAYAITRGLKFSDFQKFHPGGRIGEL